MRLKRIVKIFFGVLLIIFCYQILRYYDKKLFTQKVLIRIPFSKSVIIGISEDLSPPIKLCKNVEKPNKAVINNYYWQEVTNQSIYLYSAFYDNRFKLKQQSFHYIRIIASVKHKLNIKQLYCLLWNSYSSSPLTVSVVSRELWVDFWSKDLSLSLYKSYLISCAVPQDLKNKVIGVSITSQECEAPKNYFKIEKISDEANKKDFIVCTKGLDFQKDISLRLIEWIELQLIVGADLISFYIYNIHENVQKVLDYYKRIGKIEFEFLSLPGNQPNVPKIRSQYLRDNVWQKRRLELIPFNDCLYKHLYSHRFVVLLDIDEAIIPILHLNWKDMIDYIITYDSNALQQYNSFAAQNTYFFGSFSKKVEPKSLADIPSYHVMLRQIYRSANFSQPGFAVKSFISTDTTLAVFNHYALFPLYNNMSRYSLISKSLAQLNHYREECPNTMFIQCKDNFVKYWKKDLHIWKYKKQIIDRVEAVLKLIGINNV